MSHNLHQRCTQLSPDSTKRWRVRLLLHHTWSMSPRQAWMSCASSRSRLTGLLYRTWRLKSRDSKPLQQAISSGGKGKENNTLPGAELP